MSTKDPSKAPLNNINKIYPEVVDKSRDMSSLPRKNVLPPEIKFLKFQLRQDVIKAAAGLMNPASEVEKIDKNKVSKLEYLIDRAVATGEYRFIQYLLDQAIGRAVTPVITKAEGPARPKTIIRRADGSEVVYTLEDKENDQ